MDPNTLPTPNFGMPGAPQPPELQGVNPNVIGGEAPQPTEQRNIEVPAVVPSPLQPNPLAAPPPIQGMPTTDSTIVAPPGQPATIPAMPMTPTADDGDLIEKEWVIRAKAIVEQTRLDPHAQNKEMNKVKADYLKQRYNKIIKVEDEQ